MADKLVPLSPLGGYRRDFDGATLGEATGMALVSMAVSAGQEKAVYQAVRKAWKLDLPEPGKSVSDGKVRLIWSAPGQYFLAMPEGSAPALETAGKALGGAAWLTDQSDSNAMLLIEGPRVRAALERICPLDLDPGAFALNDAARTVMEHLGCWIIRVSDNGFLLMSARSSAASFLHAVETSCEYAL